jgi:aspartate-semialdehyde dehydrogenase
MGEGYRVAVVGATGQVGSLMLRLLREREFPVREVVPFASERSAGRALEGAAPDGGNLTVLGLGDESIQGFDLALFSAGGATSGEWAPRFVEAGAIVVDNSSRWRMQEDVPLVVSEVNPDALAEHHGIVANPNCSTMQMVVALKPLYDAAGIERLVISTYQAVSGTGKAAVDELLEQSHALLHEREIAAPAAYPHRIAFNALPHAGSFAAGEDHTDEERKLIDETRKILGDPTIRVSATCVRVPVVNGHSEAVNVQTRRELSPERARELLAAAPGVVVLDDPGAALYPLAIDATGKDDVFVGRIRRDPGHERALDLWIVADNLRKGAATNAVQIAELLHERELIGQRSRALTASAGSWRDRAFTGAEYVDAMRGGLNDRLQRLDFE